MIKDKRKSKISINSKQYQIKEIPMPSELIEQIFDISKRIGYESYEEKIYREQKEDYNALIIKEIMNLKYTDRQRQILNLMYVKGLNLTETAKELNVKIGTIQEIKNAILKKVKKHIIYKFVPKEDALYT